MESEIKDQEIYLSRISKPLQEKLRVVKYIPKWAKTILDVGCADGTVTFALAKLFPNVQFLGIDLNENFIKKAKQQVVDEDIKNVKFECVYLRQILNRTERFDSVIFVSVLHEFFSYGEGISSVLKAVSDAHEM